MLRGAGDHLMGIHLANPACRADGCRYRRVNCAHFPFQLHGHHPAAFRQFIAYQTNVSGFHCGIGGFYRRRHPDGFD